MARQVAADPMSGAGVEIESRSPQRRARKAVELGAGRSVGKNRRCNRDMALENTGETRTHLGGWVSDDYRAGGVRRGIFVFRARIDEKNVTGINAAVGVVGDPVMHDRAMRSRAGDGRK